MADTTQKGRAGHWPCMIQLRLEAFGTALHSLKLHPVPHHFLSAAMMETVEEQCHILSPATVTTKMFRVWLHAKTGVCKYLFTNNYSSSAKFKDARKQNIVSSLCRWWPNVSFNVGSIDERKICAESTLHCLDPNWQPLSSCCVTINISVHLLHSWCLML